MNEAGSSWSGSSSQAYLDGTPEPAAQPLPPISAGFRRPQDEIVAGQILGRNKEAKIDGSKLPRGLKAKITSKKPDRKGILQSLTAVVNGQERAGPGVAEVLRDMLIEQGGNINFLPPKGLMKKSNKDRTGLIETATRSNNVEIVQVLAPYSDQIGLDNSLNLALDNRGSNVHGPGAYGTPSSPTGTQDTFRKDRLIEILISNGANSNSTIGAAVGCGDLRLLGMLLEGRPAENTLSEALPTAAGFRDINTRHILVRMLLEKGANVNHHGGEAMLLTTKIFDMTSLDMLLHRSPHPSSLNRAFYAALNLQRSEDRYTACEKLLAAGAVGEEVNKALTIAITTEVQHIEFLTLILGTASVDWQEGHVISLAITNRLTEHLKLILEKRPNERSFDNAFAAALRLRDSRDQLRFCRLLLDASPAGDSCSRALLAAAKAQKEELCKVFMEKGASPDFENGTAVVAAASSQNLSVLGLLVGGQYQQPNNTSLAAGFQAALSVPQPAKRIQLLRLILSAGLTGPILDLALINALKRGPECLPLCKLFLAHGASVDYQDGEALDSCTRSGNLEILEVLLHGPTIPSAATLSRIFSSAQKLDPRLRLSTTTKILEVGQPDPSYMEMALDQLIQETRPDLATIKILLKHGAGVHFNQHRPLITAARTCNGELLKLLLEHSTEGYAASAVFEAIMKIAPFWANNASFSILKILLENGAQGSSLNEALIKAVKDSRLPARDFAVVLLRYPVDVNYNDGEALQIVTEGGDIDLITKMFVKQPTSESLSMAFPYLFTSAADEPTATAVVERFLSCPSAELDPYFEHPQIPDPLVFLCLKKHPRSLKILRFVLIAGFDIDKKMASSNGDLTALYWALTRKDGEIGDDIIEHLINSGASLYDHPESLLHLAIEQKRYSIIQSLIAKGIDVDHPNAHDLTPLNLATMLGDVQSIQLLLDAEASPNDGSLHYAARMCNAEAITALLQKGHDPNFPLATLGGRPPLFELCFKSPFYLKQIQETQQQKEKRAKKSITALIEGGALVDSKLPQAGDRSLLHHALDSANPLLTAKAFLECGQYKNINEDFNLFTDGVHTYSPTKYVEKGLWIGDKTQTTSIITLLKSFSARDRFWKNEGAQPTDYINAPPAIEETEKLRLAEEKRRKDEEERINKEIADQRLKLAREAEIQAAKRKQDDLNFRLLQSQDQIKHQAEIDKEKARLEVMKVQNELTLRLKRDENELEVRRIQEERRLMTSKETLRLMYDQGIEAGMGGGMSRPALGYNPSKSNVNLRSRAIEWNPLEEIDET